LKRGFVKLEVLAVFVGHYRCRAFGPFQQPHLAEERAREHLVDLLPVNAPKALAEVVTVVRVFTRILADPFPDARLPIFIYAQLPLQQKVHCIGNVTCACHQQRS
jgi:hypothetical protein